MAIEPLVLSKSGSNICKGSEARRQLSEDWVLIIISFLVCTKCSSETSKKRTAIDFFMTRILEAERENNRVPT